ncbi:GNAT family N-acetyltransferase [Vibrio taketomensis]|uniref:GNAT family N-acetyltransferase n=1 Tax=Vibrio taketomensis TaxID=2572923 RepID=UPI001389E938|nr:GNAT family N-acetyltransferase [Vibrio taketomensis]
MKVVCETERLIVRQFEYSDAEFIVQLLNEESFIRYIADKNVRTIEDACNYLTQGPMASYDMYGFGLSMVCLKETQTPIGMCGVLKRPELDLPDLGYAFLSQYTGQGYASEAAIGVLNHTLITYSLDSVLAVTLPANTRSNRLLSRVGFSIKGDVMLYGSPNTLYEFLPK